VDGCYSRETIQFAEGSHGRLGIWQGRLHRKTKNKTYGGSETTFNTGNFSKRFKFIKEGMGLRVTDGIRKNFEDVSLDMVRTY